jgi:hypothetical protein
MRIGTDSDVHITFSLSGGCHYSVWTTVGPLMISGTLCAGVLHLPGIF